MVIEYFPPPKQKTRFEKEEPNPASRFLKKCSAVMAAAGIATLSPNFDFLKKKVDFENGPEFLIEHAAKNNPLLKKELREKINLLIDMFSSDTINSMAVADLQAREARKNPDFRPSVNGFEKLEVDPKYLLEIFSEDDECYPKGTINGNIANISYHGQEMKMQTKYGIPGRFLAAGVASYSKDDIVFFQIPASHLPEEKKARNAFRTRSIVRLFGHELGHMQQGNFSNFMTPQERIEFLLDVTKAFSSSQLSKTEKFNDYIGRIKNEDQKKEYYLVATEYWAILCDTYLNEPEKFLASASPEEQSLIKKWLLREKGRDFDPIAARDRRHFLTERMIAGKIEKQNALAASAQKQKRIEKQPQKKKTTRVVSLPGKKKISGKKMASARRR